MTKSTGFTVEMVPNTPSARFIHQHCGRLSVRPVDNAQFEPLRPVSTRLPEELVNHLFTGLDVNHACFEPGSGTTGFYLLKHHVGLAVGKTTVGDQGRDFDEIALMDIRVRLHFDV